MLTTDGTDTPVLFPIEVTYPYPNYMPQPCRPCLAVLFITRQDALMNIWLLTVEDANGGEGLADILAYYVDRTPSCKQAIRTCSVRRSRDGRILPSCPVGAAAEIAEMRLTNDTLGDIGNEPIPAVLMTLGGDSEEEEEWEDSDDGSVWSKRDELENHDTLRVRGTDVTTNETAAQYILTTGLSYDYLRFLALLGPSMLQCYLSFTRCKPGDKKHALSETQLCDVVRISCEPFGGIWDLANTFFREHMEIVEEFHHACYVVCLMRSEVKYTNSIPANVAYFQSLCCTSTTSVRTSAGLRNAWFVAHDQCRRFLNRDPDDYADPKENRTKLEIAIKVFTEAFPSLPSYRE